MEFKITSLDYIALNNLLKVLQLVETGGDANTRIDLGEVIVNGAIEKQKRKKIRAGDRVEFDNQTITVS